MPATSAYARLAKAASRFCGRPSVFVIALAVIVAWIVTGPIFDFSDTWQLVINTATTVVTFLMVFLIQATQNRDNDAVQLKLDELIKVTRDARSDMIDLEEQSDEVLKQKRVEMRQAHDATDPVGDRASG